MSLVVAMPGAAREHAVILQSTTSAANSGLYDAVLPLFEEKTGIRVHVVAVGTGQAIRNARNGDGDVLIVHSREDEEKFVAGGHGVERHDLMYNDFLIVGPASDPARIRGMKDAAAALRKVATVRASFVSRGDDSGTHKKELELWRAADVDPTAESGTWYLETGSGMGAALNMGVGMGAYTLTDRGTWLSFRNRGDFLVHVEGDERLFNQYGAILVNPARHGRARAGKGQLLIDWLLSPEGQSAIDSFSIDGEQLFFGNAADRS